MAIESPMANATATGKGIDYSDYIILAVVALATVVWFTKGKLWSVAKNEPIIVRTTAKTGKTRDIVQKMRDSVSSRVICSRL